jgi:murein DD-endopeptidase MepM/ murein hydrolase activator NlpD
VVGLGECVNHRFWGLLALVLAMGVAVDGYAIARRVSATRDFQIQAGLSRADADEHARIVRENTVVPTENRLPAGRNFAGTLEKLGLSAEQSAQASAAAQRVFNVRQLRAGNAITVGRGLDGGLRQIDYNIDGDRMLHLVPAEQGFTAEIKTIPSHTSVIVVTGTLEDSLFHAVQDAGESAELAMRLAQIFGYDLDFYTDPRKGDTFRVVLQKRTYSDGKPAGVEKIYAAEYVNAGKKYGAVLFHDDLGKPSYYAPDGKSLQKAFLRSPLKFGAPITSHFSKARYHPILKTVRPHLGTDYGAPIGTPVQTIGSGKVIFAGRKGGDGNMVHIVHANGYETMYLHLSRILVRNGEHVEIGKVIGLVGMTGLATGPHLDFRISQKGQFKNFEHLGLPASEPVAKKDMAAFQETREKWISAMEHPETLSASTADSGQ